jgi:hypothetical protein
MRSWLLRHRPTPAVGAVIGAVGFTGLMQIFPALGCG